MSSKGEAAGSRGDMYRAESGQDLDAEIKSSAIFDHPHRSGRFQILENYLESAALQLKLDALDIYLIQPETNQPICFFVLGFHQPVTIKDQIQTWKGLVWRVIQKKDLVTLPDLWQEKASLQRIQQFRQEGFISYHAVPISTDGILFGVLETFFRHRFQPDPAWFELLRTHASKIPNLILNR
jgi:hypothetical protein